MLSRATTTTTSAGSAGAATPTCNKINSMKFINQNKQFVVATSTGFQVCETATAASKVRAEIPGGTALVDSYRNSNIFFFVGTGTHLEYPSTRLCIWNDRAQQVVGSVQFSPNMQVVDLHVLADWVLVVFSQSIKLFHFADGFTRDKVVAQFPIRALEKDKVSQGQVAAQISQDGARLTLAFQNAAKAGKVDIVSIERDEAIGGALAPQASARYVTKENFLYASDGREPITGLGFSQDGSQLHVSVNKGTLLNIYSVGKRQLVKQLGRGKHAAYVNSVSSNGVYLAACSDRGTTHLYNVASSVAESQNLDQSNQQQVNSSGASAEELKQSQGGGGGGLIQNTFSKLYYLSSFVPYYGHEFSFARLRNADSDRSTQQICHVGGDLIFLATNAGNFYACPINGFETNLGPPVNFLQE